MCSSVSVLSTRPATAARSPSRRWPPNTANQQDKLAARAVGAGHGNDYPPREPSFRTPEIRSIISAISECGFAELEQHDAAPPCCGDLVSNVVSFSSVRDRSPAVTRHVSALVTDNGGRR